MPGLQFFACPRCDTVFALPEEPSACAACDGTELAEISHELQGAAYFAPQTASLD